MKKETDDASKEKLSTINGEIENLRHEEQSLQQKWEAEKQAILRVRAIKKEIDEVGSQMEAAERAYDFNFAAEPLQRPYAQPHEQPKEQTPQLRRVPRPRVDRRQLERASNRKVVKMFAMVACAIVLFGVFCNSFAMKTQQRHALDAANEKLALQQDANIVLENRLTRLVSAENIDKIAMQRLGLVKMTNADKDYVELTRENQVLVSQSDD